MNKKQPNPYNNREELVKDYIKAKMDLVRLELVVDRLYMETEKDQDWKKKFVSAKEMYDEQEKQTEKLSQLFIQERETFLEEEKKERMKQEKEQKQQKQKKRA